MRFLFCCRFLESKNLLINGIFKRLISNANSKTPSDMAFNKAPLTPKPISKLNSEGYFMPSSVSDFSKTTDSSAQFREEEYHHPKSVEELTQQNRAP